MTSSFDSHIKNCYDFQKSTKDNYTDATESDDPIFCGEFQDIRRNIDSKWHGSYVCSRQLLQDDLIKEALGLRIGSAVTIEDNVNPWIVFTGGAMGAGKGYTMNWLMDMGIIPIPNLRHIDPDVFKRRLPEWNHYVRLDPNTAGSFTHLESSMLVEIAQEVALHRKMNVWIDGSLSDHDWTVSQLRKIRQHFPIYRIAVLHVSASENTIMKRCERRAQITGRVVPMEKIRQSLVLSVETVRSLSPPLVDLVAMVLNERHQPELLSLNHQLIDAGGWEALRYLMRKSQ